MSYIGNAPASFFTAVTSDVFSANGTANTFTLSKSISNLADIEVVVDNIQQNPFSGSYSVNGSSLTFSSTPSAGSNNIIVTYRQATIGSSIPTPNTVSNSSLQSNLLLTGNTGLGNTIITGTANVSTSLSVGANVNLSTSSINVGNSTVNTSITSTGFSGPLTGTIGATTPNTGAFTTLSATGVATFAAGSNTAPAITTTGDTNTGIFFPAADTIAFTEGGAEAMRIDSSGNVLVNSTGASGTGKLHINAADGTAANEYSGLTISNTDDQTKAVRIAYNTASDAGVIAASDRGDAWKNLLLNPIGGKVGIGVTSFTTSGGVLEISNGITFPATQSASTNANTLDDYEEGTFTPVLSFGGASVGITYTTQTGAYRKIGSLVYFYIRMTLSSKGSSTGFMSFTLPFTSINVSSGYSGTRPSYFNGINTRTPDNIGFGATAGAAAGVFYTSDGGQTLTDANFQNASDFVLAGCYVSNN